MILLSWPEISSGEAMKPTRGQPSFETDFVFVQKKVYKNDVNKTENPSSPYPRALY
jgi:hypothetical protein